MVRFRFERGLASATSDHADRASIRSSSFPRSAEELAETGGTGFRSREPILAPRLFRGCRARAHARVCVRALVRRFCARARAHSWEKAPRRADASATTVGLLRRILLIRAAATCCADDERNYGTPFQVRSLRRCALR